MGNDIFRVQVKSVHKPMDSLFYTSNMPVLPKDGDYFYVEEKDGHNHQYIVDRKDWIVSSQDGNNVCLIVIWVNDPGFKD